MNGTKIFNGNLIEKLKLDNSKDNKDNKFIYKFKVSDNKINRNGWRILTEGIDIKDFEINPVVLLNHDPNKVIGKATKIEVVGTEMFLYMMFHGETDDSRTTETLLDGGFMNMRSISILPIETEEEKIPPNYKGYVPYYSNKITVFKKSSLLEISVVTIPASATAKMKEKIAAAFNNNSEILEFMNKKETEYKSEHIINNQKGETMELAVENAKLQKDIESLQKTNSDNAKLIEAKDNELKDVLAKKNKAESELKDVSEKLVTADNKLAEVQGELEKIQNQQKENEVDVFLAKNKDRIKPAELELLKETLLVLQKKEDKLSNGKTLYDEKLNEIQARKPLELEKKLDDGKEETPKTQLDFDSDDKEEMSKIDNAVRAYSKENKVSYEEAFEVLRTENESED